MAQVIDSYIAYRVLSMLYRPFVETDAFKLGIIDAEGNVLIRPSHFTTTEQKNAYTYLHRVVFSLKRLLNKLPGGDSKLKNLIAALYLVKEAHQDRSMVSEQQLRYVVGLMEDGLVLAEEQLIVEEFILINEEVGGGATPAIANTTGAGVSTDQPVIRKPKRFGRFVVNNEVYERFPEGKANFRKIASYLKLENEGEKMIHDFAMKNPNAVLVLHNGKNKKVIRNGDRWSKTNRPVKQVNNEVV